jgi:hypothetical protein
VLASGFEEWVVGFVFGFWVVLVRVDILEILTCWPTGEGFFYDLLGKK